MKENIKMKKWKNKENVNDNKYINIQFNNTLIEQAKNETFLLKKDILMFRHTIAYEVVDIGSQLYFKKQVQNTFI